MGILKESTIAAFDIDAIHKGDLIRAKYESWPEPRNGIVTAVDRQRITVLYLPGLHNVSNYFPITVEEVASDLWEVSWSSDLEHISSTADEEPTEEAEEPEEPDPPLEEEPAEKPEPPQEPEGTEEGEE